MDRDGYTAPMPPNSPQHCHSDGYGGCETPTPTATPVPTKNPTKVSTPPAHTPTATPTASASSSAPTLPVTGTTNVGPTVILGFLLIAVGLTIVGLLARRPRRRRHRA